MSYQLSEDDVAQLLRIRDKLRSIEFVGIGGSNSDHHLVIGPMFPQPQQGEPTSAPGTVSMKIVAYATASGLYAVDVPTGTPKPRNLTTNLSLPEDGETMPTTANAYFENLPEIGTTGSHYIPVGSWVTGTPSLLSTDSPPMPVFRGRVDSGALPPGGLQYQVVQRLDTGNTDTTNPPLGGGTPGWDWPRSHSAT